MADDKEPAENNPAADDTNPKTAPEVPGFAVVSDEDESDQEIKPDHDKQLAGEPESGNKADPVKNIEQEKEPVPAAHEPTTGAAPAPAKSKRSKKRIFFYIFIFLLNAAILTATVIYLQKSDNQTAKQQQPAGSEDISSEPTATPEPPKNLHYVSDALKLEFDYPSDWRIESSPGNTFITIQSPQTEIRQANSETAKGRVVMEIHAKYVESFAGTPAEVNDTSSIAYNSEKITYKNPTNVQRKETHFSFSRSANVGGPSTGFDTIFVSGNLSYKQGAMVRSQAYKAVNPFIVVYFNPCKEDNCGSYVPPRIDKDAYGSSNIFTQAKDIIASARFN